MILRNSTRVFARLGLTPRRRPRICEARLGAERPCSQAPVAHQLRAYLGKVGPLFMDIVTVAAAGELSASAPAAA